MQIPIVILQDFLYNGISEDNILKGIFKKMKKAIICVFLAAICAILFYGIQYLNSPLDSVDAKLMIYEQSIESNAVFVRDEDVYSSDMFGTVYNHYTEGARVKSGALISTVYTGTVSEETMQELRTIDKKIAALTRSGEYSQVYDTSSVSAESIINNYKDKIIQAGDEGKISSISAYKEIINGIRTGSENQTTESLTRELENQKMMVENRIGVAKQDIYSEKSGIFTTVLDGLENYLTPEFAMQMSVSDFEAVRVNNSEAVGTLVNQGASVCKVSNNHEWYVLVCVKAEDIKDYDVGKRVQMRFDSIPGEQIECQILNKSEEQDGKVVVLLVSNYYLEGAYSFRESGATLILKSYTGYKIPIQALRNEDNVQGVIAEKNNDQKFYPCKVLYTDTKEGFAIINDADDVNTLSGIEKIIVGER